MDGCSDNVLADRFKPDGAEATMLGLCLQKTSLSGGKTAFGGEQTDTNGAPVAEKVVQSFHLILVVLETRDRVLSNASNPE